MTSHFKRRRREVKNDELTTLLNSLRADQLREILHHFCEDAPTCSNIEEIVSVLLTLPDDKNEILKFAYEVESESPFKHCFCCRRIAGDLNSKIHLKKMKKITLPDHEELRAVNVRNTEFGIVITYEHLVSVKEWLTTSDGKTKRLTETEIRHPLIARMYFANELLIVSYPGYTQGKGSLSQDKLSYEQVLSCLLESLKNSLNCDFKPFGVRAAINFLEESGSNRITIIKADPTQSSGKLVVASNISDQSIATWFGNFIRPYLSQAVSISDISEIFAKAVRASSVDCYVISWKEENIVTRLAFWQIGTEFLFVWNGNPSNYHSVEGIFKFIEDVCDKIASPATNTIFTNLKNLSSEEIIFPAEYASRLNISAEVLKESLASAIKAELITPIYRLNTDRHLLNHNNNWTEQLSDFRRVFITDKNESIDGSNPQNIEVAFRRVSNVEASE